MPSVHFTAAVLATLLAPSSILAQRTSAPPTGWQDFTTAFDAFAAGDSIVGGAVLVMRDGRVLDHHEYGQADRERHDAMSDRTIVHWASITKTLTAIAIMQLRDRGKLSLDDRVTKWVPELRQVHDAFGSIDAVTIRMLLSHSSGFQNPTWPYTSGKPWEPFEPTRWEQLVSMMPYQELLFAPGSRFGYSNPAFIYLARIIEQITGDPYETYIQKNIWTPLGLTRSYFGATPYHLSRWRSNNYTLRADSAGRQTVTANGRDFDPGITRPNSGWNAPLSDLALYLTFLAGATRGDSATARLYDTVLSRRSLGEMWRPVVRVDPAEGLGDAVGLSFFLFPKNGEATLVGHTGDQAGFRSFFYFNPVTSTAVIGAVNTTNEARPDSSEAAWIAITSRARTLLR
ncbi:MAG TPA: serine hydrolase domain-containing protein [Gemmatimonadales bacterium]|jgi:CubicO group peptidase (beta-lactamase class C family)